MPAPNSTFAIGGVSYSADSLVVAESFVLLMNISGKNPAHRKSANRCMQANTKDIRGAGGRCRHSSSPRAFPRLKASEITTKPPLLRGAAGASNLAVNHHHQEPKERLHTTACCRNLPTHKSNARAAATPVR